MHYVYYLQIYCIVCIALFINFLHLWWLVATNYYSAKKVQQLLVLRVCRPLVKIVLCSYINKVKFVIKCAIYKPDFASRILALSRNSLLGWGAAVTSYPFANVDTLDGWEDHCIGSTPNMSEFDSIILTKNDFGWRHILYMMLHMILLLVY